MRSPSSTWLRGALLALVSALAACSADPPPSNTASCTPACRDGFTCVAGTCVSACNPACGTGETCVVRSGTATCERGTADASTDDVSDATAPTDTTVPTDTTAPTDSAQPTDTAAPTDTATPTDTAAPTDSATPTDVPMRAPCGMTGQACCNNYACQGNNFCNSTMRCEAFTPEADECTTTGVCPTGRVCGFGDRCSGGARSCLRCIVPVAGGAAEGAACGTSGATPCANSFCASGACRAACQIGAAGDAMCRASNPNAVCSEFSSSVRPADGGAAVTALFGGCVVACQRDADCPSSQRCSLSGQAINDTYVRYCRAPFGTLLPGAACPTAPASRTDPTQLCTTSQPWQCVPSATNPMMGNCSAFCITDADCPSTLPRCRDTPFFRPSEVGTTGPLRMCDR